MNIVTASPIVQKIYDVSLNVLKVHRAIRSITDEVVTFDLVRKLLLIEFEVAIGILDNKILEEPLKATKTKFENAMIQMQKGEIEDANREFQGANDAALRVFSLATTFEGKLHANRIQLLCTALFSGYFLDDYEKQRNSKEQLSHLYRIIFDNLLAVAEVRNAIRDEFRRSMISSVFQFPGSKIRRRNVLFEIANMQHVINNITGQLLPIQAGDGLSVNVTTIEPIALTGHVKTVRCMIVSEERIFTGSTDNTIRIWDLHTFACTSLLVGHTDWTLCMAISSGGGSGKLFTGSSDKTIRVWDMNTLQCIGVLTEHTKAVQCLVVSDDVGKVFSGSHDSTIGVWDRNTLQCLTLMEGHTGSVKCMVIAGDRLFSGSADNTIRVWDIHTLQTVSVLNGHTNWLFSLMVSGERLFSGCYDNTIRIWDMHTLTCIGILEGHTSWVFCMVVAGGRLFSGSEDNTIRVWDMNTMQCVAMLHGHTDGVKCLVQSGNNRLFSGSYDHTIREWNVDSLTCVGVLEGHTSKVWCLIASGGKLISSSEDSTIHIRAL